MSEKTVSREDAVKAIQADRDARVTACGESLSELLERHRCRLVSRQVWIDGMPQGPAEIVLVAQD